MIDGKTGNRRFELVLELGSWIRAGGGGVGLNSSSSFRLSSGAVRSSDLAWVSQERWDALSGHEPLCPDFVTKLLSSPQNLEGDQDQLREFIKAGARLGWLLDPFLRRVHVYRPGLPPEVLDNPKLVSADPVLPGFELDLSRIVR